MLREWSDREPDPDDRPWFAYVVVAIVALAMLAMLAQFLIWAVSDA